jgi:hypothetical protein
MDFGIGILIDAINAPASSRSNTTGAAPGTATRTQGLPARSAADPAGLSIALAGDDDISVHVRTLVDRSQRARVVLEAGGPPEGACERVGALIGQAMPHVMAIGLGLASLDAAREHADQQAGSLDPFAHGAGLRAQASADDRARTATTHREEALAALDLMAGVVLELDAQAGPGPAVQAMRGRMDRLAEVADPLGWTAPASTDDVRARQLARVPCPDDGPTINPEHCYFDPRMRTDLQRRLSAGLLHLGVMFRDQCEQRSRVLEAAIERSQQLAEFIATQIVDAIVSFGTGNPGAAMGTQLGKLGKAMSTTKGLADATQEFGRDLTIKFSAAIAKKAGADFVDTENAGGSADGRTKAVGLIARLARGFNEAVRAFDSRISSLDDSTLHELAARVESTTQAEIGARLDRVLAAFQDQIQPIGESSVSLGFPSPRVTTTRAARLHPAGGGRPRLALVRHTTDTNPSMRRGARRALALGDEAFRVVRGGRLFDDVERANAERFIAADDDEIEFVRWIDAPDEGVSLQALAEPGAIDLPLERVRGVSFLDSIGAW